jgi:carboxylesterase type B
MFRGSFVALTTLWAVATAEMALPVIETNMGAVSGLWWQSQAKGHPFAAFQAIPYAQPPTGDLRFAPPVPAKK